MGVTLGNVAIAGQCLTARPLSKIAGGGAPARNRERDLSSGQDLPRWLHAQRTMPVQGCDYLRPNG